MTTEQYVELLANHDLDEQQKRVLAYQMKRHEGYMPHPFSWNDLGLLELDDQKQLEVWPTIMRPHIMGSARATARFMIDHASYFADKAVADVGCGCGVLGILAARLGARQVILGDICPMAVDNANANIKKLKLNGVTATRSDVFDELAGEIDVALFNHPFFGGHPLRFVPVSVAMLDEGRTIRKFFEDAQARKIQTLITPFWPRAGKVNDPYYVAPDHGYVEIEETQYQNQVGRQQGTIYVHVFGLSG